MSRAKEDCSGLCRDQRGPPRAFELKGPTQLLRVHSPLWTLHALGDFGLPARTPPLQFQRAQSAEPSILAKLETSLDSHTWS